MRALALLVIAIATGLALAPHARATTLGPDGGSGGTAFQDACPAGTYLAGLSASPFQFIQAVQLSCAPVAGAALGPAAASGTVHGTGALTANASCGPAAGISRARMSFTRDDKGAPAFLAEVSLTCHPLAAAGAVPSPDTTVCLDSGQGCDLAQSMPDADEQCPAGELATGIVGRADQWLDALGLVCGPGPGAKPVTVAATDASGPAAPAPGAAAAPAAPPSVPPAAPPVPPPAPAAVAPVPVVQTITRGPDGGKTGTAFQDTCPAGAYLAGLSALPGDAIAVVQPMCAPWQGARFGDPVMAGSAHGTGAPVADATCGPTSGITAAALVFTRDAGGAPALISQVALDCHMLASPGAPAGISSDAAECVGVAKPCDVALHNGDAIEQCPAGDLAVGIVGRADQALAALGLICAPAPSGTLPPGPTVASLAPGSTTTATSGSGPGGAPSSGATSGAPTTPPSSSPVTAATPGGPSGHGAATGPVATPPATPPGNGAAVASLGATTTPPATPPAVPPAPPAIPPVASLPAPVSPPVVPATPPVVTVTPPAPPAVPPAPPAAAVIPPVASLPSPATPVPPLNIPQAPSDTVSCVGGGGMSAIAGADGLMRILFKPAAAGGNGSVTPQRGECAWADRPFKPGAPFILLFPRSQANITAIVQAVNSGQPFQVHAADDGKGSLVVSAIDAAVPGLPPLAGPPGALVSVPPGASAPPAGPAFGPPTAGGQMVATTDVNIRSAPATASPPLGVLHAGAAVPVTGCAGGWCQLGSGAGGYVAQQFLRPSP